MSLINDALKRAKQAHTENQRPAPDLPLRPADPGQNYNSGIPVVLLAVLLIAVVIGGGLILVALKRNNAAPQVVHATQPEASSSDTPSPVAATPSSSTPAPTPVNNSAPATTVASRAQAASGPTPDALAATPNPEPPKTVTPKLQGIFYHPSKPSAVMSGKTVYVGSRVGEARDFVVLSISRDSVTVANGSQTNLLVLEE
jgi:hypothetical protein